MPRNSDVAARWQRTSTNIPCEHPTGQSSATARSTATPARSGRGDMAESDARYESPGDLLDKILDAAAHGTITQESALRLIFLARKAGTKGYTWWKRIKLAEHWGVHKTTITRDYEQWVALGFVKVRPNPFKASAKLITFPWCKVWDDAMWGDLEKVASMLPDLHESFRQKRREGCTHATQKGRTDATFSAGSTITENLKDENVKQQQPSAGMHKQSATTVENSPKVPGDPRGKSAEGGSCPPPSGHRDEETVEGFADMRALLARYHVGVRAGEIQALIEAGRGQTLTLEGIFGFVAEKLKQKRDQNEPVFSAKLLIKAISDEADLHHFAVKRQGCSSFFEQRSTRCTAPFSVAELRDYLSAGAQQFCARFPDTPRLRRSSISWPTPPKPNIATSKLWSNAWINSKRT
jgi:hypothetical protein